MTVRLRYSGVTRAASDTFTCFWCGRTFLNDEKTADHLRPKMLGGVESPTVMSCGPCNVNRGRAVTFAAHLIHIREMVQQYVGMDRKYTRRLERRIRKFKKAEAEVKTIRDKWVAMEIDKLGRGYSNELNLDVPEMP